MIHSQDRSGWFGASDTARIMGNWDTETFRRWWLEKLGYPMRRIVTRPMAAGKYYEHRILDAAGIKHRDRQIRIPRLRLRVNLDGEDWRTVYEVKTYKTVFRPKQYYGQCQVEMFATQKNLQILSYRLTEAEYSNFFLQIDPDRMNYTKVAYDSEYINAYLDRLKYLAKCLKEGRTPS